METVIKVEDISKVYSLGIISTQTLRDDIAFLLAKLRGKENEYYSMYSEKEQIWSLKNVSFNVQRGEVLGIIGKNGAGKSTLLKILSRVTAPTTGEIKVKGKIASLLEVGTGFHPELTGRENIFLNGAILGMSKKEIRAKFDEIVDFSGVERFIDTPVKRYSSGMYVRLAFAVAAHLDPDILIVDEVLAVGDADFQKKCLGRMKDVAGQGRTVLFVSHSALAIKNLCTKALFLQDGQLEYMGDVDKAIVMYFGEKNFDSLQKTWMGEERPGNDYMKVNCIRLIDPDGSPLRSVTLARTFQIEIQFETLYSDVNALFSFSLHSSGSELIFGSISNTIDKSDSLIHTPGAYKITCEIPGNFLNNGSFYINVNGYTENFTNHFAIENPLGFEAHDDGILRKEYKGNYSGYIRPLLNWKISEVKGKAASS
jgi:lipopolysaccharide transport system ATP-binding protein